MQQLWRQLYGDSWDERLAAARQLLQNAQENALKEHIVWLFEWLATFKKALPAEGLELLCAVLDALPKSYPLHSHARSYEPIPHENQVEIQQFYKSIISYIEISYL